MNNSKKFPKTIYVYMEKDSTDTYVCANEKIEDSKDGYVAEYQLVKVGKKSTKTIYE